MVTENPLNYDASSGFPSYQQHQMRNSSISLSHSLDMSESRSEKNIHAENFPQETKQTFEEVIHSSEQTSEREPTGHSDSNSCIAKETTSGPYAPSTFKSDMCQCVSYDISWSDISTDPESEEEVSNVEEVVDKLESGSMDNKTPLSNDCLGIPNVSDCENGSFPTATVQEEIGKMEKAACGLQSDDQSNVEVSVENKSYLSRDLDTPKFSNCEDGQFLATKLAFQDGINIDNGATYKYVQGDNNFLVAPPQRAERLIWSLCRSVGLSVKLK